MTWCDILGHRRPQGYGRDVPYLKVRVGAVDNIGRQHADIVAVCTRCGESYNVAHVHLPEVTGDYERRYRVLLDGVGEAAAQIIDAIEAAKQSPE
jgi:hypothetical protein